MPILNSPKYGNLYITIYIEIPNMQTDQILKLNEILNNNITEDELNKNKQKTKYTAEYNKKIEL